MARTILHVDMDAFFAALEVQSNPALRGKPVVVCGNLAGRGVVCSASYEARYYGIHSAMPIAEAKRRCPTGVWIEANGKKYLDASLRVSAVLLRYTPLVEPASIDEAYLDCSGDPKRYGTGRQIAERIRHEIAEAVGVTASVGIGPNKLLAKMATRMAKPNGIAEILPDQVADTLRPLPVQALPGVGEQTHHRLAELGVRTLGDLEQIPLELLERTFGVMGRVLYAHCRGQDDTPVTAYIDDPPPKSLGHEMTFPADVGGEAAVRTALVALADRVAGRLRAKGLLATHVTLKVRSSDFHTLTRSAPLARPTCDEMELYNRAWQLFASLPEQRKGLRLLGISTSGLISQASAWQMSLLDQLSYAGRTRPERDQRLHEAIDRVRYKFGRTALCRARVLGD